MTEMNSRIDKKKFRQSLNRIAAIYDEATLLQREVGQRLLARLGFIKISPKVIVDLGARTGFFSNQLMKHYPYANVLSLDIAENMLLVSSLHSAICADVECLPLSEHSVDFVFSNCVLQWSVNLQELIREVKRILKKHGLLLFTMMGTETFHELRQSCLAVDGRAHVYDFIDMHEVGDLLLQEAFVNPVVDREIITVHYDTLETFLKDLHDQGIHDTVISSVYDKADEKRFQHLCQEYEKFRTADNKLPVTYEIVYGHAWVS